MKIVLKVIEKIYEESVDDNGNIISIPKKGEVVTQLECDTEDIKGIKETFNDKGRILKTKCLIHHSSFGIILVKGSFKELQKLKDKEIMPEPVVIKGFKHK